MTNIINIAEQFLRHESGQDLIEYALVAAVISLGSVTIISSLAEDISKLITSVTTIFNAAV